MVVPIHTFLRWHRSRFLGCITRADLKATSSLNMHFTHAGKTLTKLAIECLYIIVSTTSIHITRNVIFIRYDATWLMLMIVLLLIALSSNSSVSKTYSFLTADGPDGWNGHHCGMESVLVFLHLQNDRVEDLTIVKGIVIRDAFARRRPFQHSRYFDTDNPKARILNVASNLSLQLNATLTGFLWI